MRRVVATALVAALAFGTAGRAAAQRGWLRRDARFDVAAYVGESYGTAWFTLRSPSGARQRFSPGYGPAFGAAATWWATPALGLRAHAAYITTDLPDASSDIVPNSSFGANDWLYDLSLSVRPLISRRGIPDWLASTYLFAGGGGVTVNVAGAAPCARPYPASVCIPTRPSAASVGAAVAGAGVDAYPMYRGVTLFGEAGVHAYRSPARVDAGAGEGHRLAFTPRVVGGMRLAVGGHRGGRPAPPGPVPFAPPAVPPHPVPLDTAPPPAVAAPAPESREIRICVVEGGALREVAARVGAGERDTTAADGRPFAQAYGAGPEYAAARRWYLEGAPVVLGGRAYVKAGLPRVVAPADLAPAGRFDGVPLFAPSGAGETADLLYVPVRPGCEFQPYQRQDVARRVRG
jgi:hypothetical protein